MRNLLCGKKERIGNRESWETASQNALQILFRGLRRRDNWQANTWHFVRQTFLNWNGRKEKFPGEKVIFSYVPIPFCDKPNGPVRNSRTFATKEPKKLIAITNEFLSSFASILYGFIELNEPAGMCIALCLWKRSGTIRDWCRLIFSSSCVVYFRQIAHVFRVWPFRSGDKWAVPLIFTEACRIWEKC